MHYENSTNKKNIPTYRISIYLTFYVNDNIYTIGIAVILTD